MNMKYHRPFGTTFRRPAIRCLAALVLAAALLAHAQSTGDSTATDYSSFQVIVQRNIFNPNRYGIDSGYRPPQRGLPTFSLTGTMSYRQGMYAFFDGTSPDYHKVLKEGGTIAGYTVTNITFAGAQLQGAGQPVNLKVGAAMRQDGDSWILSEPGQWDQTTVSAAGTETETPASPGTSASAPPSSSSEPNDVLRRLMEKREQELK